MSALESEQAAYNLEIVFDSVVDLFEKRFFFLQGFLNFVFVFLANLFSSLSLQFLLAGFCSDSSADSLLLRHSFQ